VSSSAGRACEFLGLGVFWRLFAFMDYTKGFVSRASFERMFVRRANVRVLELRHLAAAHRLHGLHEWVSSRGLLSCVCSSAGRACKFFVFGCFGGAPSPRPSRRGSSRGHISCVSSGAGRVCEYLSFGDFRRRTVFETSTLGFVSRASFVRVFELRASVRVLGPRRLSEAHRLRDLHFGGVSSRGHFSCVRSSAGRVREFLGFSVF